MKKIILFAAVFCILSITQTSATVIHVPGQYSTIQEGIDNSSDGDTVLVQPGTYVENINFNGHNIVLCSMFLPTGDTSYISQTIIEGILWQYASVVSFSNSEDSTTLLTGFTIRNGDAPAGGGIGIFGSSPTISHNTITNNSAASDGRFGHGGGICCYGSNSIIANNIINQNYAMVVGGGIYSDSSNPVIINNIIHGNRGDYGGGINCKDSDPTITKNSLIGNISENGGGISISGGYAIISDNIISENHALLYPNPYFDRGNGGGIIIGSNSGIFRNNIISGNYAERHGGGIAVVESPAPEILNNVFYGNAADSGGSGIYSDSSVSIVNTILWNNEGGDILGEFAGVFYCNIEDSLWPGTGNISEEPLFVDPGHGFFQLNWGSPCIDAGLPDSLDPDGTVSDMGAFYFHQGDIIIDMMPVDAPISIPAGSHFNFHGLLENNTNQQQATDVWIMLDVPGIGMFGPIEQYNNISLNPNQLIIIPNVQQDVPGYAPLGFYTYIAYCGDYPDVIIDSSFFGFDVTAPVDGGAENWSISDWFKDSGDLADELPATFSLSPNYPNPFNPTTTILYQLPVNSNVKLVIYSLLGKKVETLVNGRMKSGYHSIQWDASQYSSGVYFYRLTARQGPGRSTAGDKVFTRRMTLLK